MMIDILFVAGIISSMCFGAENNPKLLEKLSKGDPREQMEAVEALSEKGKEVVPDLLETLAHEQDDVQGRAGMALGKIFEKTDNQSDEFRKRLADLSKDTKATTATIAIDCLGKFETKEASDAIAAVAKTHSVLAVRSHAIRELAASKSYERHVSMLHDLLKDASPRVRDEAAAALGYHGDRSGFSAALASLKESKDGSPERRSALFAMSQIGDERAIPILEKIRDAEPPPEGEIVKTIEVLKFKQLHDDESRIRFLREAMRKREGNVDQWALYEAYSRAGKSPKFRALLQEVAQDGKHPKSADSQGLLRNLK